MKCHVGIDTRSGLVHIITVKSANVHDINETHKLLQENDEFEYGDNGYSGIEKRNEIKNDEHLSKIDFRINRLPKLSDNAIDWECEIEHRKSSVRCKVEHKFKIINDSFGFNKVRFIGCAKNLHKLNVLFVCANLLILKDG